MSQYEKEQVTLPPKIEPEKRKGYGTLTLHIGRIVSLQKAFNPNLKITVVFWGQKELPQDQVTLK